MTAGTRPGREDGVTLFLCGDVMTGRGVDQILPHPSRPQLFEGYVKDARGYLRLAEEANGPIPCPVDFAYIWGDALAELARVGPDARIVNLETSVTRSEAALPKGINYRMHPDNVHCLTAAGIDCCVLANNHVLDWDRAGLEETLTVLQGAGLATAGAGRDAREAAQPAVLALPGGGRLLVFAFAAEGCGVPPDWAAAERRAGVNRLAELSARSARAAGAQLRAAKRPGDIVVASIHWGGNWGYGVPAEQTVFAHTLVEEGGADLVHGHSSHHVKALEVYRGRLILYGCGDFLNDYEGIGGYEAFRGDLGLMYFPTLEAGSGRLLRLAMTPTRIARLRVNRAAPEEAQWLAGVLQRECARFGAGVDMDTDQRLVLHWHSRKAP